VERVAASRGRYANNNNVEIVKNVEVNVAASAAIAVLGAAGAVTQG
jgi:predicted ABC-type transport system involved in lysophospholipase L1 biosynthesis ATPase subunit